MQSIYKFTAHHNHWNAMACTPVLILPSIHIFFFLFRPPLFIDSILYFGAYWYRSYLPPIPVYSSQLQHPFPQTWFSPVYMLLCMVYYQFISPISFIYFSVFYKWIRSFCICPFASESFCPSWYLIAKKCVTLLFLMNAQYWQYCVCSIVSNFFIHYLLLDFPVASTCWLLY